jgi:predicted DNA-binding WGR domain protein
MIEDAYEYHLHRRDAARNMHRFYGLTIERDLFGHFLAVRYWGRIGARPRRQAEAFGTREEARAALKRLLRSKHARGYRPLAVRRE